MEDEPQCIARLGVAVEGDGAAVYFAPHRLHILAALRLCGEILRVSDTSGEGHAVHVSNLHSASFAPLERLGDTLDSLLTGEL